MGLLLVAIPDFRPEGTRVRAVLVARIEQPPVLSRRGTIHRALSSSALPNTRPITYACHPERSEGSAFSSVAQAVLPVYGVAHPELVPLRPPPATTQPGLLSLCSIGFIPLLLFIRRSGGSSDPLFFRSRAGFAFSASRFVTGNPAALSFFRCSGAPSGAFFSFRLLHQTRLPPTAPIPTHLANHVAPNRYGNGLRQQLFATFITVVIPREPRDLLFPLSPGRVARLLRWFLRSSRFIRTASSRAHR